jgi:hypothetical protein
MVKSSIIKLQSTENKPEEIQFPKFKVYISAVVYILKKQKITKRKLINNNNVEKIRVPKCPKKRPKNPLINALKKGLKIIRNNIFNIKYTF